MPKAYKDHTEKLVKQLQLIKCEPREGPLSVDVTVWATKPKTSKLAFPKPDADNYAKTVLDAITKAGNLWLDDTQVVRLVVEKRWAPTDGHVGYAVSIKPHTIL
jgi:Holliday junction resolvase RusA-like endonuclease